MASNIEAMLNSSLDDIKKSYNKGKISKNVAKKGAKANKGNYNIIRGNKNTNKNKKNKFRGAKNLKNKLFNMDLDNVPRRMNRTTNEMGQKITIDARKNRNKGIRTIFTKKVGNSSQNLVQKSKKKLPSKPTFTDSELAGIKIFAKLDQTPEPLLSQKDMYVPLPESGSIPVPNNDVHGTLNERFTR